MSIYTQPANVSICFSWFVNFPTYQMNVITLFIHLPDLFNHCPILHALELRGPGSYSPSTQASGLLVLLAPAPAQETSVCLLRLWMHAVRMIQWGGECSSMGGGQEEESQYNENRNWRVQERGRSMLLSN